jgi:hypothetical protein
MYNFFVLCFVGPDPKFCVLWQKTQHNKQNSGPKQTKQKTQHNTQNTGSRPTKQKTQHNTQNLGSGPVTLYCPLLLCPLYCQLLCIVHYCCVPYIVSYSLLSIIVVSLILSVTLKGHNNNWQYRVTDNIRDTTIMDNTE